MTPEQTLEMIKGDMVRCRVCGHQDQCLVRHLLEKHGLTVGSYKKGYGVDEHILTAPVASLLRLADRKEKKIDMPSELSQSWRENVLSIEKLFETRVGGDCFGMWVPGHICLDKCNWRQRCCATLILKGFQTLADDLNSMVEKAELDPRLVWDEKRRSWIR